MVKVLQTATRLDSYSAFITRTVHRGDRSQSSRANIVPRKGVPEQQVPHLQPEHGKGLSERPCPGCAHSKPPAPLLFPSSARPRNIPDPAHVCRSSPNALSRRCGNLHPTHHGNLPRLTHMNNLDANSSDPLTLSTPVRDECPRQQIFLPSLAREI